MSSSANVEKGGKFIQLDGFAKRQWDPEYKGLVITGMTQEEVEAKVNEIYWENPTLVDGYAPFCKHIFVPNFLEGALCEAAPITDENRHLLLSEYQARKPEELPVLVRWFPKEKVKAPLATHLDLILYSREQIIKETQAMGKEVPEGEAPPWGLISIKAQGIDKEIPMQPITMMRNTLGKEEGGSGVPMDRAKYAESVEYWSKHATIADRDDQRIARFQLRDLRLIASPESWRDYSTVTLLASLLSQSLWNEAVGTCFVW
eukprot:CAMPEP_0181340414 /NCGR_PEP_ID=MMETSP1101-20121128/29823_1 /TAXON_ID=46948 /ORGANISM="Rhodomonas abbreviata, Strain Caron Lab Isolate" /LENGTH=259 /DNA_ID=CAMNT_0023451541 /DNA_START=253 /DNA_END=1030 /DNA_ORIENTATION=+